MSLYKEYAKEERKEIVIEDDKGFISYKIYDDEIMICEFFVKEEYRRTMKAFRLAKQVEQIGIDNKCSNMSCYIQVDPERPDVNTYKLNLYMKYGFKVYTAENKAMILAKDLNVNKEGE